MQTDPEEKRRRKKARSDLLFKIKTGEIPSQYECECVRCGTSRKVNPLVGMDYLILDYDKPLDAVPICRSCRVLFGKRMQRDAASK